jgi:hypothetical protein
VLAETGARAEDGHVTLLILGAAIIAVGLVVGIVVRIGRTDKWTAWIAATGAVIATGVGLVSSFVGAYGECLSDSDGGAAAWPWSPRRELCDSAHSHAALGADALLLVPAVLIAAAALLAGGRSRRAVVWVAVAAAVILAIVLPSVYVRSLPLYRVDSYPILHDPLLRRASDGAPARVCYAYGIISGPRRDPVTADSRRTCVEFLDTPQSRELTPEYDQGQTPYELEWVGKNLTARGLPVERGGTGVDGLVVTKAYELPGRAARTGSARVDGAI